MDKFTRPFMTNGLTRLHFVSCSFFGNESKQVDGNANSGGMQWKSANVPPDMVEHDIKNQAH